MRLEEQLSRAVEYCTALGIALKGDIPIMMNEDSCDTWANPEFFRDDLRAGNPPDMMNPLGQNWGFPIYNWENLKETGYDWWKQRLAQCSKFYNAYRIDHILGFFRIWSIPYGDTTGYLGWTTPHEPITGAELAELGFVGDRLRWICEPHVPTRIVEQVNNNDYLGTHGILRTIMNRIGEEELWLFKPEIKSESDIVKASIPDTVKSVLISAWRDRMMQISGRDENGKQLYVPIWNFRDTTAWRSLSSEEKEKLERLFRDKKECNEQLWKTQAKELLGTLTKSVDMLPCAEDLGSIPESVPEVLSELKILGLKVLRWERLWQEKEQPFKNPEAYPQHSVATTSVHDSSTLRGWWDQEHGGRDFLSVWKPEKYGYSEGTTDRFLQKYTPEVAAFILKIITRAGSKILAIPVQDFLSLSSDYYQTGPEEERINIPGTVSQFNWTYRLPENIEGLVKNKNLVSAMTDVLKERRSRTTKKGKV